jgi:hypothetical protein
MRVGRGASTPTATGPSRIDYGREPSIQAGDIRRRCSRYRRIADGLNGIRKCRNSFPFQEITATMSVRLKAETPPAKIEARRLGGDEKSANRNRVQVLENKASREIGKFRAQ